MFSKYIKILSAKEGLSAFVTGTLLLLSWLSSIFGWFPRNITDTISIVAALIGGGVILIDAIKGLMAREMNVDELVIVALLASFYIGEYLSAALVAFMMLFGKVLEDITATRAEAAIKALGSMLPKTARVKQNGHEKTINIYQLNVDDVLVVRPGERISVDGKIIAGEAMVDQSALTGESALVLKVKNGWVLAGSVVVEGAVEIKAKVLGNETTLGSVSKLAQQALTDRAPIVKLADKYAKFFTPIVLLISVITYLTTHDLNSSVAVLVAACPCVLVLATPTATIAGVAAGAKRGLLIKGGSRIESAANIDTVVFDKTGTLTIGEHKINRIISFGKISRNEIISYAASAEYFSEHPIAKAIIQEAKNRNIPLKENLKIINFKTYPGLGVKLNLNSKHILVGTTRLFKKFEVNITSAVSKKIEGEEKKGHTSILIAKNNKIVGLITLVDVANPQAKKTILELKSFGIKKIIMLTGDNLFSAQSIARQIGIKEIKANLLPRAKLDWIKNAQKNGHKVAMVGDGVNDAPSLAVANLSIAMGSKAADVTRQTADITISSDDLFRAAEALLLSKQTFRTIKQNLVIAGIWNILAIGTSATGYLSPIGAALVHNLGSVFVVINATRLINWKPNIL